MSMVIMCFISCCLLTQVDGNREPLSLTVNWRVESTSPVVVPQVGVVQNFANGATKWVDEREQVKHLLEKRLALEIEEIRSTGQLSDAGIVKLRLAGQIDIANLLRLNRSVIPEEYRNIWEVASNQMKTEKEMLAIQGELWKLAPRQLETLRNRANNPLFSEDGIFGKGSLYGKIMQSQR